MSTFDAGYEAGTRAIALRTKRSSCSALRPSAEHYTAYQCEWEAFVAGWAQALREDKERQIRWNEFYDPTRIDVRTIEC